MPGELAVDLSQCLVARRGEIVTCSTCGAKLAAFREQLDLLVLRAYCLSDDDLPHIVETLRSAVIFAERSSRDTWERWLERVDPIELQNVLR